VAATMPPSRIAVLVPRDPSVYADFARSMSDLFPAGLSPYAMLFPRNRDSLRCGRQWLAWFTPPPIGRPYTRRFDSVLGFADLGRTTEVR
jgi:hypothetical protein